MEAEGSNSRPGQDQNSEELNIGSIFKEFHSAVSNHIGSIQQLINEVGIVEFVDSKLGNLFVIFQIYTRLLNGFHCTDFISFRKVLEERAITASRKREEEFEDSLETFFKAEKSWDEFLEWIDMEIMKDSSQVESDKQDSESLKLELESLETLETSSLKQICSVTPFTWFVFLRHFA